MKVNNRLILGLVCCTVIGAVGTIVPFDVDYQEPYECLPGDQNPECYDNGLVYYEDAPYGYDGYWSGGGRRRHRDYDRSDRRGHTRRAADTIRTRSTNTPRTPPSGPSHATMSRTPVSGGLMSGGHMSGSMGAGATIGHGHR